MLPQTAFESKEEDAGIVKRKDQGETTDDNRQETPTTSATTTAATRSCDSQLPAPVMKPWIIVSIAKSLFFICILVFEIWKKMAQDLEDKSILVGHESQKPAAIPEKKSECHVNKTEGTDVRDKNEKNSGAECTDGDTPLIGNEDRLCCTKKIEEIKEQDLAEFPSEDNVEKTMCAADHGQETENSEVLDFSPATQHIVSQSKLEDLKVLPSCDATSGTLKTCVKAGCPMEASTDTGVNNPDELVTFKDNMPILDKTEMCLQHSKEKTVDNGIVSVQFGPSFTGNLYINVGATAMCEDLRSEEMTTKLHEPQKLIAENVTYQNYVSEHYATINCMQRKSSDNLAMSGTLEEVSPSLQYLMEINQPKDTVDGSLLSMHNDMFMFPLDNDVAVVNKSELPSQIDTKPKRELLQNADSEFSKSLDSQKRILEKGCKLLETRPFKSSLRSSGSDGCLKKSVHFPEDIRNIRTVHKYDSFDEGIWLKIDRDKTEEETNNVKD